MGEYKPKVGDRVRVVIEDEVSWTANSHEGFDTKGGCWIYHADDHTVTVEKIVTVFKPGDRLRERGSDYQVTLGSDGYLQHFRSGSVYYHEYNAAVPADFFSSEVYELVEIG
jgi:hypothetical protein